ncbi:unnamed protein product [Caenorhabditis angaria]|uniref:Uncharacterized protein n=1 Tax=Caenorhabditis angaria TaxID=860376 RepID=A0A9P1IJK0_9PELO|nr:unnamed protein product [Caenorhabditis angaria]
MLAKEDLSKAFEDILESVIEETGLGTSSGVQLNRHQQRTVDRLHKFVNSSEYKRSSGSSASTSETISFCDDFIADWEASGLNSSPVQQLINLLNRPHIRGLLWSTEDVSAKRFAPELPAVPFEVDEDEGIAVKIVRIVRRDEPLGATIKCDHGGRVYVARIISGGVADRSGCIQEGDRVLEVNGESVLDKKPDEIVQLLNKCDGGCVTFKLIPVEVWHNHSSKAHNNNEKSHIHLRALFDYDGTNDARHPCPEAALNFRRGDILELLVCNDEYWWQARRLGNGALAHSREESKGVGLIPSELLQQKSARPEDRRKNTSQKLVEKDMDDLFYESVCKLKSSSSSSNSRPIVLIGPPGVGRNELKRRLLMMFPERFSTTVPHTSRSARNGENDGIDYYFTTRKNIEKMIENDEMLEFGEFRGNLYGTAVSAVRMAKLKGTPLLTPHPLALRQLRTSEFMPFIIFVQPPTFHDFKETREAFRSRTARTQSSASSTSQTINSMGRAFTDSEIRQIIENASNIDRNYGHLFDSRITNTNLDDTMSDLIKLIHNLETKSTWVPLNWATRCVDG